MSPLHAALDKHLAMRRALGHKLCLAGHLLQQFVALADQSGVTYPRFNTPLVVGGMLLVGLLVGDRWVLTHPDCGFRRRRPPIPI
jgi:hypothetical protein